MDKKKIHNLVLAPIFLISLVVIVMGAAWCIHPEPWLLDRPPNEALLQTSFNNLFSAKINIHLPAYLIVIYKFFGLWLISIGLLILAYTYVTRLGTTLARNIIHTVLFLILIAVYYLVFNFIPTSPFMPILFGFTVCLLCSRYYSKQLKE